MRTAAAKRVKIKVVGGTDLTISVTPARPRKGSYLFVLEQKVSGKWRKVGRYRTIGKQERRTLDVRSGKYRVRVKAIAKSRGATKTFSYAGDRQLCPRLRLGLLLSGFTINQRGAATR